MRTRKLGARGPEISRVGFGAWTIGGRGRFGWGEVDDDESVNAVRAAIELGVNWIDTAAVYGLGHSEEVVGRAIRGYRAGEDILVFTKCGLNWYESGIPRNNLRPDSIRFECDQSLKRLGIERIDLYQFHWPDPSTPVEESWGTLLGLIEEGKVRWAGVSNFDIELLERCEAIDHVESLQPPLNLIQSHATKDVIPWCFDHGTGAIVYSPMASGLLSGAFDENRLESLPPDDWRRGSHDFRPPALQRNLSLVDNLRPLASRLDVSVAELVIAWTLHVRGVSGAICGARSASQVRGWAGASDLDLDSDHLLEIERIVESSLGVPLN